MVCVLHVCVMYWMHALCVCMIYMVRMLYMRASTWCACIYNVACISSPHSAHMSHLCLVYMNTYIVSRLYVVYIIDVCGVCTKYVCVVCTALARQPLPDGRTAG